MIITVEHSTSTRDAQSVPRVRLRRHIIHLCMFWAVLISVTNLVDAALEGLNVSFQVLPLAVVFPLHITVLPSLHRRHWVVLKS